MEAFSVDHLTFSYPGCAVPAVKDFSLQVEMGQFVTLCGPSGCGKSTLLRQLKTVLTPAGTREGTIRFMGAYLESVSSREQAAQIGFVRQSPDDQIVTDKVWHELAFGLESLGFDTPAIRSRVAEMAGYFGIQNWFHKSVTELSGGQKQLLNLAAVMVMQPKVLILDEPTSQLDPIAASDFLATVGKINRELGTTVIMTEHRLEEVFPLSHQVVVMDRGSMIARGTPDEAGEKLRSMGHAMFLAMPCAMRVWAAVPNGLRCPITVREGRDWLEQYADCKTLQPVPAEQVPPPPEDTAIEVKDVWFRYEKEGTDILKGLSLRVPKGQLCCLLGGNGMGKTTALSVIGGLRKAYRGKTALYGRTALLPQDPQTVFVKKTVLEDLLEVFESKNVHPDRQLLEQTVAVCRLGELLERHPYDLSGGEQQRAALAKVLLTGPEILLMDEPTKGLDAEFKQVFAAVLDDLLSRGVTVLMVSHDVEFCAEYAHRCALFFDGNIVSEGTPRRFFCGNSFYTTSASRMARGLLPDAVTANDVIACCGGKIAAPQRRTPPPPPIELKSGKKRPALPLWRKLLGGLAGASAVTALIFSLKGTDLSQLLTAEGITGGAGASGWMAALVASLLVFTLAVSRKREKKPIHGVAKQKLPKGTAAAALLILLLIPATIWLGNRLFGNRKYLAIALLVLLEAMLPFVLIFEGRRPQARELVLIAVLCAMGVAGRAAFFMLPNFKPVMAVVIISGVALGGRTGFLVGALTMLISNMLFGQGPWTPWQMFAMGLVGFLAGILFRRGAPGRLPLCLMGALSAILIYGGIMNAASALMWAQQINAAVLASYYITGFPVDLVHAAATFLILWFGAEPMLEKLERIKTKYGLIN